MTNSGVKRKSDNANLFASRILRIVVGINKVPFNIHEDHLALTSFFKVEGKVPETAKRRRQQKISDVDLSSTINLLEEEKHSKSDPDDVKIVSAVDETITDFHLVNRAVHSAEGFEVFVNFLYGKPPVAPKNESEVKISLQAYLLALRYECFQLQDHILDTIREYHTTTLVELDNLVWMINRVGDSTECLLTAYLVEQIAYEIVKEGLDKFMQDNSFMQIYLEQGHRKVRVELFKAVSRFGQWYQKTLRRAPDPATTKTRRWYVKRDPQPKPDGLEVKSTAPFTPESILVA